MRLKLPTAAAMRRAAFAPDSLPWLRLLVARPALKSALSIAVTPWILEVVREAELSPDSQQRLFSLAMRFFRAGHAWKMTCLDRSPRLDQRLLSMVSERGSGAVLDVGTSDGSSSWTLHQRLGARLILTDKDPHYSYIRHHALSMDIGDCRGRPIVRKLGPLAFRPQPSAPRTSERGRARVRSASRRGVHHQGTISCLNPRFSASTKLLPFDCFLGVWPHDVAAIKCANLLHYEKLPQSVFLRGIENLGRSIMEGGFLFVGQNHPRYAAGEAYVILQRTESGLRYFDEENGHVGLRCLKAAFGS